MYGRETPVGYQKSSVTGSVRPACCSSCFALSGVYGYLTTVLDQQTHCGVWHSAPPKHVRRPPPPPARGAPGEEGVPARLPVEAVRDRLADEEVVRRRLRLV